ncbi:DUF6323 family protein [Paenibacillus sp. J2TS4]|uniref:DUF6323 family protein n=1 Tax=Paenibacillus sp. J2TS4 TaxID=2807194 RepID=UPI001B2129EC|nr:DUF6323 family protein [Paenibacillus sp. J2TS4]GIP35361.1 hypothetical protein J2TS4_45710 [Paenibacillus sp. J2TS4]
MFPSRIWNELHASAQDQAVLEILELNEKTKEYGLVLTPEEVKHLIMARNQALSNYGRVELGIEVSKALIEEFASSPYIRDDNYASVLNELHEIFYYIKNETEDRIGDFKLIGIMRERFDHDCGGSIELLKSKLEEETENYRREIQLDELMSEGDDD